MDCGEITGCEFLFKLLRQDENEIKYGEKVCDDEFISK